MGGGDAGGYTSALLGECIPVCSSFRERWDVREGGSVRDVREKWGDKEGGDVREGGSVAYHGGVRESGGVGEGGCVREGRCVGEGGGGGDGVMEGGNVEKGRSVGEDRGAGKGGGVGEGLGVGVENRESIRKRGGVSDACCLIKKTVHRGGRTWAVTELFRKLRECLSVSVTLQKCCIFMGGVKGGWIGMQGGGGGRMHTSTPLWEW